MKRDAKGETAPAMGDVLRRLFESPDVCDQRKGNDLVRLRELSVGLWAERFRILGFDSNSDGSLAVLVWMRAKSFVWGEQPIPHDSFTVALSIPRYYPLSQPAVRFVGTAVPFCPHVVNDRFLPELAHVPAEFQEYVRRGGHGSVCYLRSSQWSADSTTHNLAIVVWQVSRVITFNKAFGEAQSLNPAARDHARRLAESGGVPLGDPLPFPHEDARQVESALTSNDAQQDEDIEWSRDGANADPAKEIATHVT